MSTPTSEVSGRREEPRLPPGRAAFGRRRLLLGGLAAALGAPALLGGYGFALERRWVEVTRRRLPVRDLPASLEGLLLVQLTDIHHGPWTSLEYVRSVVESTNGLRPDVVLLTGDYVHRSASYAGPVAAALGELRPRVGTVAVLGNHDWWEGAEVVRAELQKNRVRMVDNSRLFVTPDRELSAEGGEGLCLAGVGDLWEDRCLFDRALGGLAPSMPRFLLSHNPDAAEEPALVRGGHRVDLLVCGHTHGGQVRIPFLGSPAVPSRFGAKYARGLVEGPTAPVFISRGIGTTILPLRFGARPEIAALELTAGDAGS